MCVCVYVCGVCVLYVYMCCVCMCVGVCVLCVLCVVCVVCVYVCVLGVGGRVMKNGEDHQKTWLRHHGPPYGVSG